MCPLTPKNKKEKAPTAEPQETEAQQEPAYIDLENAVSIYKERIRNLEKFRELFFETKAHLISLETKIRRSGQRKNRSANAIDVQKIKAVTEAYQTSNKNLQQLTNSLQSLEIKDEQQRETIQTQINELYTLKQQMEDSNNCITTLEIEIQALSSENAKIKHESGLDEDETQNREETETSKLTSTQNHNPNKDESYADGNGQDLSDNNRLQKLKMQTTTQAKMIHDLEEELSHTTNMAFTAMRSNADIGSVIHFLVESFKTQTMQALTELVFNTLDNYHIKGIFEKLWNGKSEVFFPGDKTDQELTQTLRNCHAKGKLVELKNHIILNATNVRLVIKGYDANDIIAFNNLKDNLQILVLGLDSNIERIQAEINSTKERSNLEKLVITTHRALDNIGKKQKNESVKVHNLAIAAISDLNQTIGKMSIPKEQKTLLMKKTQDKMIEIEDLVKSEILVDQGFVQIINSLKESINKKGQAKRPQ